MGLEDNEFLELVDKEFIKKRYPKNFGHFDCQKGITLARTYEKKSISFDAALTFKPKRIKHNSLDKITDLMHLFLLIKRRKPDELDGAWSEWKNQHPFSLYDRRDRELYQWAVETAKHKDAYKWIQSLSSYRLEEFVKTMSVRKVKNPDKLFDFARNFFLEFENLPPDNSRNGEEDWNAYGRLRLRLTQLALSMRRDANVYSEEPVYRHRVITHSKKSNIPSELFASLNQSIETMLFTNVDCCISGYYGKSRDASILYRLDPHVHILNFCLNQRSMPFGLAIFVEAEGYHVNFPDNPKKYLVFEGFPANSEIYSLADKVSLNSSNNFSFTNGEPVSFSKFVYFLGLATAKYLGYSKLFINAQHSGVQRSVEDVVSQAASESKLSENYIWKVRRNDDFILLKDPTTKGDFQKLVNSTTNGVLLDEDGKPFEYTHFLQKLAFPDNLVHKLQRRKSLILRDKSWNGESFFDTWYHWNKFIMDTYPKWSEELKKQHTYAEAVYKRGKEPQWNLGIGYCKGFEVDVAKEYKRLGLT